MSPAPVLRAPTPSGGSARPADAVPGADGKATGRGSHEGHRPANGAQPQDAGRAANPLPAVFETAIGKVPAAAFAQPKTRARLASKAKRISAKQLVSFDEDALYRLTEGVDMPAKGNPDEFRRMVRWNEFCHEHHRRVPL